MKRFNGDRPLLGWKVFVGAAVTAAVLGAIGIAQYREVSRLAAPDSSITQAEDVLDKLEATLSEIRQIDSLDVGYAMTGDAAFLKAFEPDVSKVERNIGELTLLVRESPAQVHNAEALERDARNKIAYARRLVEIRKTSGGNAAKADLESGTEFRIMADLEAAKDTMITEELGLLRIRQTANRSSASRALQLIEARATLGAAFLLTLAILVHFDLRGRRELEKRVRAEREFTESLLESLNDGIVACNTEGKLTRFNRAAKLIYGQLEEDGESSEWLGDCDAYDADGTLLKPSQLVLFRALKGERLRDVEVKMFPRNGGSPRVVLVSGQPIQDDKGSSIGAVELLHDITATRVAAERLRENEELYRSVVTAMADGVIVLGPDRRISAYNQRALQILEPDEDGLLGLLPDDLGIAFIHEDGSPFPIEDHPAMKTLQTGEPLLNVTMGVRGRKGGLGWILINTMPLQNSRPLQKVTESGPSVVVTFTDITTLKRVESELRATLAEKDSLLKEIHHRVKNNLQIVSSLLHMQAQTTQDEGVRELFRVSENRVHSMAGIHESLYRAANFSRVQLVEYLRHVVDQVVASYQISNVTCVVEGDESITVTMHAAIPCGLIVNELVSNALKYAFDGATGEVVVSIRRAETMVHVTVKDNGRGLPEDVGIGRSNGLGLQLVETLTKQLHGTIETFRENGTRFEIEWKAPGKLSAFSGQPSA
jgi:PAS domain S-box-containing protein